MLPLIRAGATLLLLFLVSCAKDNRYRMIVSAADQRMAVFDQDKPLAFFKISTSKFALSDSPGSNGTPLGRMEVAEKFGGGQPLGMKFSSRRPTGEIVRVNAPGRDPIVTRILWLKGLESQNRHTYSRFIYIHGTPEERFLGYPASYGCIRMSSRDVAWLYKTVGVGAKVQVVREPLSYHLSRNR